MDWLAQATTAVRSGYDRTARHLTLGNLVSISWVSIGVVICVLIFQDLSRDLVTIEPISTPKTFAEDGYTPEVASRRLHDALNKYADNAGTSMQNRKVESREELPDFIVPKIDLSINAIVASIRDVLHHNSGQRITGEFVVHDNLVLRLRVDGLEVFSGSGDRNDPDRLLTEAVPAVMDKIRPYLVISTQYNIDPKRAVERADYIINHLKSSDVNVEWAYILKGKYFIDQKQFAEAEKVLRAALSLNWSNAVAHNNLGFLREKQNRLDEAMTQYERAIAIDPNYVLAHNNLGIVLRGRSRIKEAIAEHQSAIKIDPASFQAHLDLGVDWERQNNDFDAAILEYNAALGCAKTKHDVAIAHDHLGTALWRQSLANIDQATKHYRLAIESDPNYSEVHDHLGRALGRQRKLDEALSEFRQAVEIDPNNAEAKSDLDSALQRTQSGASKRER
jgi:tetratricopeptide (TPR) repeat protein